MAQAKLRILGAMTGTSCDGMDVACVEFDPLGWRPLWHDSVPYPATLRKKVLKAQQNQTSKNSLRFWMELHRDLGLWYASAIVKVLKTHRLETPDAIANHGQTIAHHPSLGVTLQLGDPSRIAYSTRLTVLSNFRDGDLAAGGQGAPLVPKFHHLLVALLGLEEKNGVAFHNIGGISNLTYVGRRGKIIAFDTGPGNIWVDAAAERATRGRLKFDLDGKLGKKGKVDTAAVQKILMHPFFSQSIPKSTGRDDFPFNLLTKGTRVRGNDLVATATAVTVESVARAYERFILSQKLPLEVIALCGGGAMNPNFLQGLKNRLPQVRVMRLEDARIDGQYVEAQAFAYLGLLSLCGVSVGGRWTGMRGFAPPAHIIPGQNWLEVLNKLRSFA